MVGHAVGEATGTTSRDGPKNDVSGQTDRLIDSLEAIVGPTRWAETSICAILLVVGLALAGAWAYALLGGLVLAMIVVKIRRKDQARSAATINRLCEKIGSGRVRDRLLRPARGLHALHETVE